MRFRDFRLERYFAEWEFSAKILLGSSDPESMRLAELLALADDDGRARWDELWLGYTESAGLPALREAIAAQFTSCGPADVLVFSAPEEVIFHVAAAVLEPGDHMVGIRRPTSRRMRSRVRWARRSRWCRCARSTAGRWTSMSSRPR